MAFTLDIGAICPHFELLGTDGLVHKTNDYQSKILVIFFSCNHCPFVIGSDENTRQIALEFKNKDVQFVAINSNSVQTNPTDSYEDMVKRMQEHQFPWDYLHDKTQEVAKKFGALRTPHFFVFNEARHLMYTGRSVDQPRKADEATTEELREALLALTQGNPVAISKTNPIGCNVKWDGKDAHWMPPEACDLV